MHSPTPSSHALCNNSSEPIIVPWIGLQWHNDVSVQLVPSVWPIFISCLFPNTFVKISGSHFFPKGFAQQVSFGIYLTALCSHSVFPCWHWSPKWAVCVCELREGKGYFSAWWLSAMKNLSLATVYFCGEVTSSLLCQTRNRNDVRKELQTGLPREVFFEKSTKPNHKFMRLWTGRQDLGTFQAFLALLTCWFGMK